MKSAHYNDILFVPGMSGFLVTLTLIFLRYYLSWLFAKRLNTILRNFEKNKEKEGTQT